MNRRFTWSEKVWNCNKNGPRRGGWEESDRVHSGILLQFVLHPAKAGEGGEDSYLEAVLLKDDGTLACCHYADLKMCEASA
jgi:hypothetical protein